MTYKSIVWSVLFWGGLIVTALATLTDPAAYGIPAVAVPYIRLLAFIASVVGGKLGMSYLKGPEQPATVDIRKIIGLTLAVVLASSVIGCAKKHVVTQADMGLYTILGTVQDSEMALHQAGVIGDADHGKFNARLKDVLIVGRDFNRVVRDWPVGTPKPATLAPLAASLSQGLGDLLGMLPQSPQVAQLRTYLQAAVGLIVPFLSGV